MDSLPPRLLFTVTVVLFLLIVLNTVAKTANVVIGDAWLKQTAEDGNKKAKRLLKLLEKSSASVIDGMDLFAILLNIAFAAICTLLLYRPIFSFVGRVGSSILAHILTMVVIVLAIWIVHSVFAVLVPKRIASKSAENMALTLSGYSMLITSIMKPFLIAFVAVGTAISYVFGVKNEDIGEEVTEEEIRMMVDIGSESGAIDDDEKQMIHNIFEMNDKPVEEIMTHRKEVVILWLEDGIDEWRKIIDETNHTRYPVCNESVDNVIGVVTSRDFYRLILNGDTDINKIMRDVYFIPDTVKADELLSQMQRENEHMGVVMDEYGGFQGIVTQEDLIEEIVGELYSEYDEPEIIEDESIKKIGDDRWLVYGGTDIECVEEELGVKIEDGDYNTFAGFILNEIQTIPADGEMLQIETNRMIIKVTSVIDHRIEKAIVTVLPDEEEEEDGNKVGEE